MSATISWVMFTYLMIGIVWFSYVMWRHIAKKQPMYEGLMFFSVFQWPLCLTSHLRRRLWNGSGKFDVLRFDGEEGE